jgi:hypothetical protein
VLEAELVLPAAELIGGRVVRVVVGDELGDRGVPPVLRCVTDRVGGEEVTEERDARDLVLASLSIFASTRADLEVAATFGVSAGELHGVEETTATVHPGVAEEIEEALPGVLAEGLLVDRGAELLRECGGVSKQITA